MKKIFCTAGMSHFMLYPNGDVYRCMDWYNDHYKPLFNILDKNWNFYQTPQQCKQDCCYAGCDVDWAQKFILHENGQQDIIEAQVKHYDKLNGQIWTNQTMQSNKNKFAHIIWAPTLICNYSCVYCGCSISEKKNHTNFFSSIPELNTDQWLTAWTRLMDYFDYATITMSGGEPFLSSATMPVLEHISNKFSIGLTTNMSKNIMELTRGNLTSELKKVDGIGQVRIGLQQITASLHPSSKNFNSQMFKGATLLLKNNMKCALAINFVGYPSQLYLATEWKAWAEANDIRFILSPWCGTDNHGNISTYTVTEQQYFNSLAPPQRQTCTQIVFNKISHKISTNDNNIVANCGKKIIIIGSVTNTGDSTWERGEGDLVLKVGGRLRLRGSSQLISEYRCDFSTEQLDPGKSLDFSLNVDTTELQPRSYTMYIDIVREGAYWMQDKGAETHKVDINIIT